MYEHDEGKHDRTMFIKILDEHKWYLSEQVGHDVGYHYAMHDFVNKIENDKFYIMYLRDMKLIEHECHHFCKVRCCGVGNCPIPKNTIDNIIKNLEE